MQGNKYTAEFKIGKVREYLEKIENGEKITKADFAYQNNLSDSTFNDWVIKYQKLGKGVANVTDLIAILKIMPSLSFVSAINPGRGTALKTNSSILFHYVKQMENLPMPGHCLLMTLL